MNFLFRKHSGALVALLPLLLAGCSAALETVGGYSSDSAPTADPSGGGRAGSGIVKSCEYLLRSFSLATGGTYVFLTNDSGAGGEHIAASVGEYQVEKLWDLIARLIIAYAGVSLAFCI